jgi:hypothetical protein
MADGSLTFMAQERSNKIKDINENPQVAATILLIYKKSEEKIGRQKDFPQNRAKFILKKTVFQQKSVPGYVKTVQQLIGTN